jgi:hypothetical protein
MVDEHDLMHDVYDNREVKTDSYVHSEKTQAHEYTLAGFLLRYYRRSEY